MFKVIVIDDEEETRSGIIETIQWDRLGLVVAGQAANGLEGIRLAEETLPDIVLLDVRMPKLNGIECAREIRSRDAGCKIIFMSGYSDKEYLKSAIRLQAVDYIEKPLSPEALEKVLSSAAAVCRRERARTEEEKILQESLEHSAAILKQELALQLVHRHHELHTLKKRIDALKLDMPFSGNFRCILIKFNWHKLQDKSAEPVLDKDRMLDRIDGEFIQAGDICLSGMMDRGYAVVHCYGGIVMNLSRLKKILENIQKHMNSLYHCDSLTTASIGKTVRGLENIPSSYHSARNAMQRLFIEGYDTVIYADGLPISGPEMSGDIHARVLETAAGNQPMKSAELLRDFSAEVKRLGNVDVNEIKNIYISIISQVMDLFRSKGLHTPDTSKRAELEWIGMLNTHTMEEVTGFLCERIGYFCSLTEDLKDKSAKIRKAVEFIRENYGRDFSIEDIANHVLLSPTYLCSVFKKEMGKTVNQYIEEYRIEKAKQLLRNLEMKLSDISARIGYSNAAYFISVFKKVTGMSPSEYRKRGTLC